MKTLVKMVKGLVVALFATVIVVIGFALGSIINGLIIYWLWNEIVPAMFALKQITYVQAIMLSILCSCLFKSSPSNK